MFPSGVLLIRAIASARPCIATSIRGVRYFRQSTHSLLNRIFVEKSEVIEKEDIQLVHFPSTDDRFKHLESILKIKIGDSIKMGVVDVGVTDKAKITGMTDNNITIDMGSSRDMRTTPKPPIDLILAFPRPARLSWLFPVISSLGVGRISLIRAAKTEKGYMASHYYTFMNDKLRKLLVLGLSQASVDCWMPQCDLHPSHDIQLFFNQLDELYPPGEYLRLLAHPLKRLGGERGHDTEGTKTFRRQLNNNLDISEGSSGETSSSPSVPFHRLRPPTSWSSQDLFVGCDKSKVSAAPINKKIVIAVGPEGGWSDEEIHDLVAHGFVKVHMLGHRVLRTDIAVPALLTLAYEWYDECMGRSDNTAGYDS